METRKTDGANDRQDLLAEMLGAMARLRAADELPPPMPSSAATRDSKGVYHGLILLNS